MTAPHPLVTPDRVAEYISSVHRRMTGDATLPPERLRGYVLGAPAVDVLDLAVQLANVVRDDDDALSWMAVDVVEPLVDLHWAEIAGAIEGEARDSAPLRKVLSCCDFDAAVPQDLQGRLAALVGPDEDVLHTAVPTFVRARTALAKGRRKLVLGLAGLGVALGLAGGGVALGTAFDGDDTNVTGPEADQAVVAAVEAAGGGASVSIEQNAEGAGIWQVEITREDGSVVEVGIDGENGVVVVEPDTPESDEVDEPDDGDDAT